MPSGVSACLTNPSLPAGTVVLPPAPYAPANARPRRRVRTIVTSTRSMNPAVRAAMKTMSGAATATSGAVGVPGAVYSADAPSTKQISPPTNSRPWLSR